MNVLNVLNVLNVRVFISFYHINIKKNPIWTSWTCWTSVFPYLFMWFQQMFDGNGVERFERARVQIIFPNIRFERYNIINLNYNIFLLFLIGFYYFFAIKLNWTLPTLMYLFSWKCLDLSRENSPSTLRKSVQMSEWIFVNCFPKKWNTGSRKTIGDIFLNVSNVLNV